MSNDRSSSGSTSIVQLYTSHQSALLPVTFGPNGQPVGLNSSQLCTTIGRVVKTYVPPSYDRWTNVPAELKEQVWKVVSSLYDVPTWHKKWVIRKANVAWKDWKCNLRRDVYDKYRTDEERKNHVPHYVNKEDWERFVDICSTPEAQALREMGKIARKEMKSPHTSGRKGQARVAEELRKKNPTKEITRTHVYIATHTRTEQMDAINKMIASDPSSTQRDLNNDPVALVCGPDTRGRVRGMGLGVSKTVMQVSAPYKKALEQELASHATFQIQIDQLRDELKELKERVPGTQIRFFNDIGGPSQVRRGSSRRKARLDPPTAQIGMGRCKLMHIYQRSTCVAKGRVVGASTEDPGCYRIIVDRILEGNTDLLSEEGTFADLTAGNITEWPQFRTVLY